MGRDSRGHYIKINSLIPLAKVWLSYRRAYRSTQAPEGGWEVEERAGGRGCKQALWHVHTNHPHLDTTNTRTTWRTSARETNGTREEEKENGEETEKEGKNERGDERRQGEEEEGHRCVHGVPETAYGNGGVC